MMLRLFVRGSGQVYIHATASCFLVENCTRLNTKYSLGIKSMMIRRVSRLSRLAAISTGGSGRSPDVNITIKRFYQSAASYDSTITYSPRREKIHFKVVKNDTLEGVRESTKTASNIDLSDYEINIADKRMVLNSTWLRDSCHCNKCTHHHSRQRLMTAKDFRREMFVISDISFVSKTGNPLNSLSDTTDEGFLEVKWADGHESSYSLSWLSCLASIFKQAKFRSSHLNVARFKYPNDDFYLPKEGNKPQLEHWNVAKIVRSLAPIEYDELVDGFQFSDDSNFINANRVSEMSKKRLNAISTLASQLVHYGLCKVVNVPMERGQVLKVARSLAYERPTGYGTIFDVVIEPSEEINLAYSSLEFDLHSDLTYREMSPGVQLLHCIMNSEGGGLSYFCDAFNAAQILKVSDPELFSILCSFPATFVVRDPYRNMKFRRQQPVLTLDSLGDLKDVYYSPFMLPPVGNLSDVKMFYVAFDKLTQLLQDEENKFIVKMERGDLFIFHNRRILHGRSAYDATKSGRFLQGCYMDWDEITSLYEKLHSTCLL